MESSTYREENPRQEAQEIFNDPPAAINQHGAVEHHPGDSFKKIVYLFKSKASKAKNDEKPVEKKPAGPMRTSGQGLRHGANNPEKAAEPETSMPTFVSPVSPILASPAPKPEKKQRQLFDRSKARRAYWDVAAALSLIVNAILVGVLLVMGGQIKNLKTTLNDLVGGLYGNFVEMDKATISTTIPVDAQIPLVFNLPIQQNTTVTLTSDVQINGARVVITSGGLSINAPANVTLPSGTSLPIALNMDIPVQLTVPISIKVPVDIPLNKTELHAPFTGLQDTIRPLYCTLNKNAQYPQGIYICSGQESGNTPTP